MVPILFPASVVFLILFCLFCLIKVPKNYVLYKKVTKLKGFLPNPSPYLIGHGWYLWYAYKAGYQGLQFMKPITCVANLPPYSDIGYCALWIGNPLIGFPIILPTRTELIKEVFSSKKFVDKSCVYKIAEIIFGHGLVTAPKETWTRRRKLLNPTFHQQMLQSYLPAMTKQSAKLVHELKLDIQESGSNEILNITHRMSDRIMAILMETIIDCEEDSLDPKFTAIAEKTDEFMCYRLANPWKMIPILYDWTREGKIGKSYFAYIRKEAGKLVENRIKQFNEREKDNNSNDSLIRPALIDALINDHRKNPDQTTVENIVDETVTFLATGWDTTTWTASFTLLMIGLYPEVQEKVYQEIVDTITDMDNITMADTMKLKYLECVLNETMRLTPLVHFMGRELESDLEVSIDGTKVVIPGESNIALAAEFLHRNPKYWIDPERFWPERFLPENSKDRDLYSFMPFSAGPRNCIGKSFGLMEDKVLIAFIVANFKVKSLDPLDRIRMNCIGIARRTFDPLRFEFEPRCIK